MRVLSDDIFCLERCCLFSASLLESRGATMWMSVVCGYWSGLVKAILFHSFIGWMTLVCLLSGSISFYERCTGGMPFLSLRGVCELWSGIMNGMST